MQHYLTDSPEALSISLKKIGMGGVELEEEADLLMAYCIPMVITSHMFSYLLWINRRLNAQGLMVRPYLNDTCFPSPNACIALCMLLIYHSLLGRNDFLMSRSDLL